MWIQVRTIDGSQTRTIEDVSRKATIEELRERVWALFDVRPECQRLFYRGKQVRRAQRTSLEALARAAGCLGWAGRRAWCAARTERTWLHFGWAAREAQSGALGPPVGRSRVPATRVAGALGGVGGGGDPSAETYRPCQAGQQPQAQPARVPGVPPFPRLVGSVAPGGRGGQRALAAMPKCGWGGQEAPALGRADPANGSYRFRTSDALPTPKWEGKLTYCSLWGTRL